MRRALVAAFVAVSSLAAGCSTYHDQLGRGQRSFEQNDYEHTLLVLRDLERDTNRLPTSEQAEYAYLRGMSNFRMGYRPEAYHWLAVAKAYEDETPGVLPADWKVRTDKALGEMKPVVAQNGLGALAALSKPGDDTPEGGANDDADTATAKPKAKSSDAAAPGTEDEAPKPKPAAKPATKPAPPAKKKPPSDDVAPGTEDDAPAKKPTPPAKKKPKPADD